MSPDDPDDTETELRDVSNVARPPPARPPTARPPTSRRQAPELEPPDDPTSMAGAYAMGEVIGRGGMGEVLLAHDRRIGRDVALKRLRSPSPTEDEVGRFLREARIQARLDHPAIVPVYEMSKDALGRPYFTMKRLSGSTLSDVLAQGGASQLRLLRAFADLCRAVDFAHSRGVVHRDLKPANIVLGEFGEVYVLDWGVAQVLDDRHGGVAADIDTIEGTAREGEVIGTPGYLSPEQLANPEVGAGADVYALGAILFELLACESLHPRGTAALASTVADVTVLSPASRRPDRAIAPELDALCCTMVARRPSMRPTARRCAELVEQYLDGDRDLARRQTLATEMVWTARAALDHGQRAEAMRTASRALALDPNVDGAAEIMTTLMLEPPREAPPELAAALQECDEQGVRRHAKEAIPGYVMIAAFMPIVLWTGIRQWSVIVAAVAVALGMAVAARALMRQPHRSLVWMVAYAAGNAAVIFALARITGPLGFVPALLTFITASVITYPVFHARSLLLIGIMLAGFVAPILLEVAGVLSETWSAREGGLLLHSNAIELTGSTAIVTLVLASAATLIMAGRQSSVLARANRLAQHQLVRQSWHLRQLLPAVPVAGPRVSPEGYPVVGR